MATRNFTKEPVHLRDVWKAQKRISPFVNQTPLIYSQVLSDIAKTFVYLKLENLHITDSFKIRGAANKILSLTDEEKRQGITTFSTGNFARSVAYIANKLGIRAVVCVSKRLPHAKVEALKSTGVQIVMSGESQDDAKKRCEALQEEQGLTVIHPFDDPYIIAGQGTMGLEILNELPEVDTVVGGLSGGGMHSGLGVAMKSADSRIGIYGVSPKQGATMYESMQAKKPILIEEQDTLEDSLLGGIGVPNHYTFELVKKHVDDIVLLNEEEIAQGMVFMMHKHRMIIEGAAAAGIGAILNHKIPLGSHVVLIISGCSVDPSVLWDLETNS